MEVGEGSVSEETKASVVESVDTAVESAATCQQNRRTDDESKNKRFDFHAKPRFDVNKCAHLFWYLRKGLCTNHFEKSGWIFRLPEAL